MSWTDWLFGGATPQTTQYQDRNQLLGYVNQGMGQGGIAQTQAPQLASTDAAFRNAQIQQMGQLQGIASGATPGAGELAAQRQYANANAAQQSLARSARGGANAALAYRNAANQSAALGSSAAGAGQQAALQDQANAQNTLAGVANAGRAGDYQTANANAGYQAGTNALNSQNYLGLLGGLSNMDANQLQSQQAAANNHGFLGPLLTAGGQVGAAALSDRRQKTDVTDGRDAVDKMLDGLTPKDFAYKDPKKFGAGKRVGIMAQDLERSDAGKRMIVETQHGKAIDVGKAVGAALAANARLHERLKAVEKR